jgi:hypothetical protein
MLRLPGGGGREGREVQRHDSGLKNEEDKGGKQSFLSGDYSLLEKEGKRERDDTVIKERQSIGGEKI